MLSWSAETMGIEWNRRSITDASVDPLLPGGRELVALVDAVHGDGEDRVAIARTALVSVLGADAAVEAAGVIGNFNQMNRLADATGMPVGRGRMETTAALRVACGIERFHAHTP